MKSTRTTIVDGHIYLPVASDLPDGTLVEVQVVPIVEQIGLSESQWEAGNASKDDWIQWLATIEPIDFARPTEFDTEFGEYNIQAVREQMFGDGE